MRSDSLISKTICTVLEKFLSVKENKSKDLGTPGNILLIRQHNKLGDLLAGVSLFRAIKKIYPDSTITLVCSPFNYPGMVNNRFIDRIFVYDKKKLFNPFYLLKTWRLLREEYDIVIVPVIVTISSISNFLARIANAKCRIGANCLNGIKNDTVFFFDRRVDLDWRAHPDSNVSERSLDIVRPFGINTRNYRSEIIFNGNDEKAAEKFISSLKMNGKKLLVGLHVGADIPSYSWSLIKYVNLVKKLKENFPVEVYLTGSRADKEEINYVKKNCDVTLGLFLNHSIPEVAALISKSKLFISNDTGIMHVAGTTGTPQISIFGPTNPFNWAPIGANKYFIRKSELIDDVAVDDVYHLCDLILNKNESEK
ncbi:MAG: glycosyltransferase family 9 protein [Ignavibacteria bacterium]|nr:glycosyltransferase family 9 protein [Ignavibacteria bacterium]